MYEQVRSEAQGHFEKLQKFDAEMSELQQNILLTQSNVEASSQQQELQVSSHTSVAVLGYLKAHSGNLKEHLQLVFYILLKLLTTYTWSVRKHLFCV